jgi:hypothetical protein
VWDAVAVTASGAKRRAKRLLRTVKSCGPDAPVLASSCVEVFRAMTVTNKPVTEEITYKP